MTNQSPKQDIYSRVTARILAELEKGVRPWIVYLDRKKLTEAVVKGMPSVIHTKLGYT